MFVTTGTVKTHVRHIYEKALVNNRQELLDKVEAR
ncbi:MAG: LuxR C-terminal-related transcriptional regulator [Adlercreutzia sp.]|nr:LuxR C-terminal-related transcriptional regulator [Adlercreutzia sp.]